MWRCGEIIIYFGIEKVEINSKHNSAKSDIT